MFPDYKMFFWSESLQRTKLSMNHSFLNNDDYEYIGLLSDTEYELILEALFVKHINESNSEDDYISLENVIIMYQKYQDFQKYVNRNIKSILGN